jgi:glucokinase
LDFPFPVLVGDIGGTNARFSLITEPGGALSTPEHRATKDFPSLQAAIGDVVPTLAAKPKSVIACAAGPVRGRRVDMTNAKWSIDGAEVARDAGFAQGLLLNDFEAQALAVPILKDEWVRKIGDASENSDGAQLILGPGTGLGASALLEIDGKHFALASEAGHVDFGPVGAEEGAIWPHIPMTHHGRISAESVLSGPGLLRLHNARLTARSLMAPSFDEAELIRRAKADHHGEEADTVRLFWRLAARFAGDMTMAFLATGGVTFSGGVLPRLVDLLDPVGFRARFEDKAPFGDLLRRVGTRIIIVDDAVLSGLGAIAADPDRYAIDYATRAWCSLPG